MGNKIRGVRDGTGSYSDSYRRRIEKKTLGIRKEAGEECPIELKKINWL